MPNINKRVISVLATALFAASCGKPAPRPVVADGRPFTDDLGRTVVVPAEPRRIVCTSPEITEILFAVGAGDFVVGVVRGCDWPPAAAELPTVGDFSTVSVERVVALDPDLIITTGHEQERIIEQLEPLGVPVVAFLAPGIDAVRRNILTVGGLTGHDEEAAEAAAAFEAELDKVKSAVAATPEADMPRVYLEICPEPLMTVSEGSFVHEAIELAGGVNVGTGLPRPYSRIEPEAVIARNPEVIVLCHGPVGPAAVADRTGWADVAAVRSGRIYEANPDLVLRAGPRLAAGVASLHEFFYAEAPAEGGTP